MNVVIAAVGVLWAIRIGANILTYIHLWFVKEYRFDRMIIHLKTDQGKRILFPPFRIPPRSPKTVSIFFLSVITLLFIVVRLTLPGVLRFLIADLLTFPATAVFVVLVHIPTYVYHRVLITQSVRKLKNHTGMRVVGITGSYGKTSTKEFMATILGARFHVLKTHASQNSPIGIAEAIVKNIKKNHDVFIVEMGAYKRGEIAEMTRMVHPSIGLVTAVNAQHQDLFGTLDTTVKAKYELIEGLPRNGIAILNAENTYTRKMGEWAQSSGRPVWWYSVRKPDSRKYAKALWASDIQTNIRGVSFICHMGERHGKVSVPVLGAHQVSIILGAIAGAVACGMDFTDALQATSKITSVPKTMEPVRGVNGSLFINDTFTNNPDAARAALAFLEHTKGRKIFVFQPMIELGTYTVPSHEDVGKYAASICDDIILTNSNFLDAFRRGVERIVPHKEIRVMGDRDAARYIARTVTGTDTVLFKGKESERILRRLVSLTV